MSRDVCGICWCPYDDDGKCGCENVKVINPAPTKMMKGTCIRCGKPFSSVDDIHTCTPKALVLAGDLESGRPVTGSAAEELRRLHESLENKQAELLRINARAEMHRMDDEALLRQALEALENCGGLTKDDAVQRVAAITALRARLEGKG